MAEGLAHPLLLSTVMNMDTMNIGGDEVSTTYVFFTWCGMIALLLIGLYVKSKISLIPGKTQSVFEALVGGLEDFIVDSLGEKGRCYVSFNWYFYLYLCHEFTGTYSRL